MAISDNFTRADENPIVGWSEEGAPDFGIISNVAVASTAAGTTGSLTHDGVLATANHYAECKIVKLPTTTGARYSGPMCRKHATLATRTGYTFEGAAGSNGARQLVSWSGGTATVLASDTTDPVLNDVWRVEANGTTIRGLINGSQIFSVTDSPGISGNVDVGYASWQADRSTRDFDDFLADDLAAGADIAPLVGALASAGVGGLMDFGLEVPTEVNP